MAQNETRSRPKIFVIKWKYYQSSKLVQLAKAFNIKVYMHSSSVYDVAQSKSISSIYLSDIHCCNKFTEINKHTEKYSKQAS